jgi:hypothetical protein
MNYLTFTIPNEVPIYRGVMRNRVCRMADELTEGNLPLLFVFSNKVPYCRSSYKNRMQALSHKTNIL